MATATADAHGHDHGHHHHHHDDGVEANAPSWTDGKRYAWLLGLIVPLAPFLAWGLASATDLGVFWWFGPFLVFGLMPVLDWLIGVDAENPPDRVLKWLEQDRYYRWCTYAYLPLQYLGLVLAAWLWSSGDLGILSALGLAITMGCVNGIGINTAHELGHKRASSERWLSRIALAPTGYGHFFIEHNRGHHVRVATPEDPASSRMGESFWAFWPRTVSGSFTSAWELERTRLQRAGHSVWSLRNDVLSAWTMTAVLFAALAVAFGPIVLPFLLLQAVFGFSLLEVVNYLEHYGLRRQKRDDGRYERCQPRHSWNSNNVASNVFLYHLQRHSDHHAHPLRRYQALRHVDDAPQLPSGYATMILAALVPPVWRKVMDHRVVEHYGGDLEQGNLQPSKRERILARYGTHATDGRTAGGAREVDGHDRSVGATGDYAASRYQCPECATVYDEALGMPREGLPAGTAFRDVPDDWTCPDCGVRDKLDFVPVRETAGAAG